MIRMFCRGLRPVWVAAFGVALAVVPALAASRQASQTSLLVDTRDLNGHTQATLFVAVSGADGLPATGTVEIRDHGKPVAGYTLNLQGQITQPLDLAPGDHSFTATYRGDSAHLSSQSQLTPVRAATGTTPDFSVSIAPGTLSLKQGQSGSAVVSVTPINAASLTAPMFVTISCAGLPDQTTCTFTPENIEIPVGASAAITSSLVIATQSGSLAKADPTPLRNSHSIALAVLLPGSLVLAGFAFGVRRRRFLSRLTLVALVGLVTILGATACSPLYNYRNHGPLPNLPTPPGNYNVTINAQSSNGVTATTRNTNLALTVTK